VAAVPGERNDWKASWSDLTGEDVIGKTGKDLRPELERAERVQVKREGSVELVKLKQWSEVMRREQSAYPT
jgi:hypothetical protein